MVCPEEPLSSIQTLDPNCFASLVDAVAASRPGDTIVLQPGMHFCSNVSLRWPLQLVGGGSTTKEAVLICPGGKVDAAIECWASCRIAKLSIRAQPLSCCIRHYNGNLLVDSCSLSNERHPLDHLCSPILMGVSSTEKTGKLSVVKTLIEGGSKAISHMMKTCEPKNVRVVYSNRCLFWFDVA
eukprot:CAMPEP_0114224582 /NCGR_PEP_ID=MMETSP0058-20121206/187_1 /TAXON_ID=36894 /ORGANISM="Pyramimonas parkeae, CCMP726" /LENGTH=182 /DNA_ID=CAMNT_0001335073 /DNA_START=488 /DNA_END=1036 /DNA_ORIENTATION=-